MRRDYFALRDRLGDAPDKTPAERFARALVQHAFNESVASNATIAKLVAERAIPDSLAVVLRRVRLANDLRLFTSSSATMRRMGGAGGVSELPVRVIRTVTLVAGDTIVALDSVDVVTRSLARTQDENYLDCNIGHDVLDAFTGYVLNFRSMTFLLR